MTVQLSSCVTVERGDGVAVVTIDDGKANAISPQVVRELEAAIQAAAGAVILLSCDARVGLDGPFKIGLTEVAIGLPLPSFVTILARERLDPRQLVAATLGAKVYDPQGAADVGYLDRVVSEEVVATATDEARRLGAFPPEGYRLTKESARRILVERLRSATQQDVHLVASLLGGSSLHRRQLTRCNVDTAGRHVDLRRCDRVREL